MPLQYVILAIGFLIAIWDHFRKRDAKGTYRAVIPILLAMALASSCWLISIADTDATNDRSQAEFDRVDAKRSRASAANWQADSKKWQEKVTSQVSRIEGKLGSEQMTKNYLDAVRTLTQEFADANTSIAAEKYFKSKDERQKLRDEVKQINSDLVLSTRIRIRPIYDLVATKFSRWQIELTQRNMKVSLEQPDVTVVELTSPNRFWQNAATLKFETGAVLQVRVLWAAIEDGRVSSPAFIYFWQGSDVVCQITCDDKSYNIYNSKAARYSFLQHGGASDNPIEDKAFITAIDNAIDQMVGYSADK